MFLNIIDSLVPRSQRTSNADEVRTTRVVYIYLFLAVLFAFVLGTVRLIRGDTVISIAIYSTFFLACFTPLIHHSTRSLKFAAAWMIFLTTTLFVGQGALSGGLLAVSNIWFAPLSVFILLTLGSRITFIWIGGIALRGMAHWILKHKYGIDLPNFQNPETAEVAWILAIPASLLLTTFLLQGFFFAHKTAIQDLAEHAGILKVQAVELQNARDIAIAATKSRGEFIAIVSHEIRTPMNGIMGVAQLLNDTPLNADQIKYLQALNQSAEGLLSILNDILDFSKLEAGKLDVRAETFELKKLCMDTMEIFSGIVQAKGIKLDLNFHDSLSKKVVGDPIRIR